MSAEIKLLIEFDMYLDDEDKVERITKAVKAVLEAHKLINLSIQSTLSKKHT